MKALAIHAERIQYHLYRAEGFSTTAFVARAKTGAPTSIQRHRE
jgi:hypothetical protein